MFDTTCPDCVTPTVSRYLTRPRLCEGCALVRRRQAKAKWLAENHEAALAGQRRYKELHREEIRDANRTDYRRDFVCVDCGDAFTRPGKRGPLPKFCMDCRIVRRNTASDHWNERNPERVLGFRQRAAARRRAAFHSIETEIVERKKVFERDNWTCQGCCLVLDPLEPWPSPTSPSLDHIIPVSRGGGHTYANTQLLCLRCNQSKGARIESEAA